MSWQATQAVRDHSTLAGSELLCLLVLSTYAGADGGNIFPSVIRLAHQTKKTRRGTQKILKKLLASGELVETGHAANNVRVYRITLPMPKAANQCVHSFTRQDANSKNHAANYRDPSCELASSHKRSEKDQRKNPDDSFLIKDSNGNDDVLFRFQIDNYYMQDGVVYYGNGVVWKNAPELAKNDRFGFLGSLQPSPAGAPAYF